MRNRPNVGRVWRSPPGWERVRSGKAGRPSGHPAYIQTAPRRLRPRKNGPAQSPALRVLKNLGKAGGESQTFVVRHSNARESYYPANSMNSNHHEQRAALSRRSFLKESTFWTGAIGLGGLGALSVGTSQGQQPAPLLPEAPSEGETLYNGIKLPKEWPPKTSLPNEPMPVPYLEQIPEKLPIDVGRQLFVDDFLIAETNMERQFHQPEKYERNPVLNPREEWEMNEGHCPMAAPFSDGVFYDPKDGLFKMWYMSGWYGDKTALAVSADGLTWERPKLDVVPGTNIVLHTPGLHRDGVSVWIDHDAATPAERYKMYMYVREGSLGGRLEGVGRAGGYLYTSPDGIHWQPRGKIGPTGDNSTFFYNPFRKRWVFTIRPFFEAHTLKFEDDARFQGDNKPKGRTRAYWENKDFLAALGEWRGRGPEFWLGTDKLDPKRENYPIGEAPQLYKIDAAGYESLMIGFIQMHYGPANKICAANGYPKLTELQIAFSRDGFHWDRSNRETFIGATLRKDSWERAYIHSVGGVCAIVGDKLRFYYTAFKGDETKKQPEVEFGYWTGMYANASTGVATLRRDGFASMNSGNAERTLLTRPVVFNGEYLFVNLEAASGELLAEICDEDGKPIPGFERANGKPVSADSTKHLVEWNGGASLGALKGKPVRIRFHARNTKLYAFWVSQNKEGKSAGAVAAGGPGLAGTWDV